MPFGELPMWWMVGNRPTARRVDALKSASRRRASSMIHAPMLWPVRMKWALGCSACSACSTPSLCCTCSSKDSAEQVLARRPLAPVASRHSRLATQPAAAVTAEPAELQEPEVSWGSRSTGLGWRLLPPPPVPAGVVASRRDGASAETAPTQWLPCPRVSTLVYLPSPRRDAHSFKAKVA